MENDFELTDELLEKINAFTRRSLTKDEVYAFPVVLCDNEVDRDNERFSIEALRKLAELFIGKTGIFDHDPKGKNQTARIFDTEIKTYTDRATSAGEPYTCLVAKAYMVRTASSADLIAEIEGGIKKEVSISCSVGHKYCSICRVDRMNAPCTHTKGQKYNDKVCTFILDEPTDAYEWSFVVQPAVCQGKKYELNYRSDDMGNKEQIKELKEQLAGTQAKIGRLEKELNLCECMAEHGFGRVDYNDKYYSVMLGSFGTYFATITEADSEYDDRYFRSNNYFHTKERAEEVADKIEFLLKLERLHDILCPDYVPDWENYSEEKYFIFWGCLDDKYDWSNVQTIKTEDDVYFPNKETVQKACDMLNNGEI